MKFFISYNHSDKNLALAIASELEKHSVDHFLDEKSIDYGDDIMDQVSKNLTDSTHMAVIISPGSLKSTWVPYEIGFARANNLKIVPILQHPAIDLPAYIRNLKYCKDISEFGSYIDGVFDGDLIVDVNIEAGEMNKLDKNHIIFSVDSLKGNKVADNTVEPALIVAVKNRMGREIELDNPTISFQKPQKGIIPGKEIQGIGAPFSLDQKHILYPNAETNFYFYNKSLMMGIINALLTCNIDSIQIETKDGLKKIIRAESMKNIDKIVEYYRIRFPSFCKDLA
ncbi:TIR domain-containing protein [Candidatus Methanophagaceae archaeon]|jgi:hypothetical protein|nr:TIR domain-containing protein [Methanophagales archaeon]